MKTALVLGSGGPAAIAWETGAITGLADEGVDVRHADLVIGTSGGAVVGAQIRSASAIDELFSLLADPARQPVEAAPRIDFTQWREEVLLLKQQDSNPTAVLRHLGAMALRVSPDAEAERRDQIAARLSLRVWPTDHLGIVAVDVESGERCVFDRASGVDLIDAATASGAVPGVWPVVEMLGRRYMDGGTYSLDNADLAKGCDDVLVLTIPARMPPLCMVSLQEAVDLLERGGAHVRIVVPDDRTRAAFATVKGNLLDPAVRTPAAFAGREQGRRVSGAFDRSSPWRQKRP